MKKTFFKKFKTKLDKLLVTEPWVKDNNWKVKFRWRIFFSYDNNGISYWKYRYFKTKQKSLDDNWKIVYLKFSDQVISSLNSNLLNPPRNIEKILMKFNKLTWSDIQKIIIWNDNNYDVETQTLNISDWLYSNLWLIIKEEWIDKEVKISNRFSNFIPSIPWLNLLDTNKTTNETNYKLLLNEIVTSWKIKSADIKELFNNIESGNDTKYVLEKTINKQANWLIESIQTIIDEDKLTRDNAKELWNKLFWYSKASIKGPEHLMEKILTDYWKNVLFWVPVLLSMKKYIQNNVENWRSKSQFDILLIDHLSEIQIVELKRPDTFILEYDSNRWKFYLSKDLSIAVAQAENYISLVYKDHDIDYKIDWKLLRDYINDEIWGTHMPYESCRPTALIIIWSCNKIAENFDLLPDKIKQKVWKESYERNRNLAYREISSAFKNIKIITYSDLLDMARTRLAIDE